MRVLQNKYGAEEGVLDCEGRGDMGVGCRKLDDKVHKFELPTKYHSGKEIKENEMGGAYGTYGRREERKT